MDAPIVDAACGPDGLRRDKFDFGFDDAENPTVMLITVPLAAYAKDGEDGVALMMGKLDQCKTRASGIIAHLRQKMRASGVINPHKGSTIQ